MSSQPEPIGSVLDLAIVAHYRPGPVDWAWASLEKLGLTD